jgi:hypothetical protein
MNNVELGKVVFKEPCHEGILRFLHDRGVIQEIMDTGYVVKIFSWNDLNYKEYDEFRVFTEEEYRGYRDEGMCGINIKARLICGDKIGMRLMVECYMFAIPPFE